MKTVCNTLSNSISFFKRLLPHVEHVSKIWYYTSKMHLSPPVAKAVILLLLIVTPIMGFCNYSIVCSALLYVHSSLAIIFMGKRELVALLSLSSWCLMIVVWLFLVVPLGLSAVCDCAIS